MRNILIFYQELLDYTIPNLGYSSILKLKQIINLGGSFYKNEIETIAKTDLLTYFKNIHYTGLYNFGLTELQLYGIYLDFIPDSIEILNNLTYLNVSHNKLTKLPETIGNLTNLTHLWIDNNKLTKLPDTIGNLNNLTYLNISYNNLTYLPNEIINLSKLEYIYIKGNKLTDIPVFIFDVLDRMPKSTPYGFGF